MEKGCPPQPTRGFGDGCKFPRRSAGRSLGRKLVLGYLELERTHLIATNLTLLTFLLYIFSHILVHIAKPKTSCNKRNYM